MSSVKPLQQRQSIKTKLIVFFSLLIAVIALFIFLYFPSSLQDEAIKSVAKKAQSITLMTAYSVAPALFFEDSIAINDAWQIALQNKDVEYLVVVDSMDKILDAHQLSEAERVGYRSAATKSQISEDGSIYQTKTNMYMGSERIGALYLGISLQEIAEDIRNIRVTIAVVSLTIFLLGMIAVFSFSTAVTVPLRNMVGTVEGITGGDLSKRAEVTSHDEVGQLAESFNLMLDDLQQTQGALEQLNRGLELRVQERTKELQLEINERMRAEMVLRESEERYRRLFEESKDGILIFSPDRKVVDINPAGLEIYGFSTKEELLSTDMNRECYARPEERELVFKTLSQKGFVKDSEFEICRRDGERRTVIETITAIMNERNSIIGYRGLIRDVTEQKRLERQLLQAQKMESIGTLAGGIAHDFNNILSIILGYSSRLGRRTLEPEAFKQSLDSIKKAVQRGAGLVRQLLTFARKTDTAFELININDTVDEVLRMISETFPKMITFSVNLDHNIPPVYADYNQMHQSLLNLCVNARDAMPEGGSLHLESNIVSGEQLRSRFPDAKNDRYSQIIISDTGSGMPEHVRLRIFEPFFTTKERGKGTGLGLAMVYGIVKNHQGFIDLESEVGAGTTFHLYFPIPDQEKQEPELPVEAVVESGQSARGGSETILVVEDEQMLRELLRSLLEANGYRVLTAEDGLEAVELSARHMNDIALVLTDMGLPKLGGWEAFKKMRELKPDIKVILASGYLDPNLKAEMIRAGAKDFVQKPYEPDRILRRVREIIDDASPA